MYHRLTRKYPPISQHPLMSLSFFYWCSCVPILISFPHVHSFWHPIVPYSSYRMIFWTLGGDGKSSKRSCVSLTVFNKQTSKHTNKHPQKTERDTHTHTHTHTHIHTQKVPTLLWSPAPLTHFPVTVEKNLFLLCLFLLPLPESSISEALPLFTALHSTLALHAFNSILSLICYSLVLYPASWLEKKPFVKWINIDVIMQRITSLASCTSHGVYLFFLCINEKRAARRIRSTHWVITHKIPINLLHKDA